MTITFNGTDIETTNTGYLVNIEDWREDLARQLAAAEDIELTERHWDVINYLPDEYFNNSGARRPTRRPSTNCSRSILQSRAGKLRACRRAGAREATEA